MESFGIVRGHGKALLGGISVFFPGDDCKAKLIAPVCPRSLVYWVEFEGDLDAEGNQIRRCRELVTKL